MKTFEKRSVVICLLILTGLFLPVCKGFGKDAEKKTEKVQEPLKLELEQGIWQASTEPKLKALLISAANVIYTNCGSVKMPELIIKQQNSCPFTNFERDDKGRVRVLITEKDESWGQHTYQFAHEFCHVVANQAEPYEKQWIERSGENHWFEESLAEMSSLFVLRALPEQKWYADKRMKKPENNLPKGVTFKDWFKTNEPDMRKDDCIRDRNTIVAQALLPVFEKDPGGWEAVNYLNRKKADKNETIQQYLQRWHDTCPAKLQPFVKQIQALFPDK